MTEKLLTISELASLFKINQHTIRHYEEKGLLLPVKISENGYRKYGVDEIYQLSFILFLKELGISLAEIKTVLEDEKNNNYSKLLMTQQKKITQERARLKQLSHVIDQQLAMNIKANEQNYVIEHSVSLKVLKVLPLTEAIDMAVLTSLEWTKTFALEKVYYLIYDTYYEMCVETTGESNRKIKAGSYPYCVIEGQNNQVIDRQLEKIRTKQGIPLIVIEDGGRFLSRGKQLALKVLGQLDD